MTKLLKTTSYNLLQNTDSSYAVNYFRPIKKNDLIKLINIDKNSYSIMQSYRVVRKISGETIVTYLATVSTKILYGYETIVSTVEVVKDVTTETALLTDLDLIAESFYEEMKELLVKAIKADEDISEIIIKKEVKDFLK